MSSAAFKIRNLTSGGPWSLFEDGGFDASAGDELEVQLEANPAPDIWMMQFSCIALSDGRTLPVFDPVDGIADPFTAAVSFTLPAAEFGTFAIQGQANGGPLTDDGTTIDPEKTKVRYVAVRSTVLDLRHPLAAETDEYNGTGGWAVAIQEMIDALDTFAGSAGTYVAGAGLTESPAGTFNVGANGDGSIVVNANDIQVGALGFARVQTALGLASSSISVNSQKITSLATPTSDQDAATKAYVDAIAQGLDIKASVLVATTANITLSGTQTIDSVSVTAGKRVLVKNQSTGSENGIYVCAAGAWSRATDMAAGASAAGNFVFVEEGTTNADSGWVCTSNAGSDVVGTDSLAFTQFSGAGQITAGAGMTKTGNTLDVVAADGTITVNTDSIEATGSFGAKNISQTGATSITAGSGGFIGVTLTSPSTLDLSSVGAASFVGGTTMLVRGVTTCTVQAAGGAFAASGTTEATLTASAGAVTIDASAGVSIATTNATAINIGHGTILTTVTGQVILDRSGIGTTKTVGIGAVNTTVSGSQVSPQIGGSAVHSGSTVHSYGFQIEPQTAARAIVRLCYGTGAYPTNAPSSTGFYLDTSDGTFGLSLHCGTFVSSNGNGFRMALNGGGMKENGSGRLNFSSSSTSESVLFDSALAAGDSDPIWDFQSTVTRTAGTFVRILDSAGTWFSISSATGTKGHPSINGVDQGYWRVTNDTSTTLNVTAADTYKFFTLANAGAVTVNLPAGATGLRYWFKNKGAGTATLTPNGAEKLFTNAQVATFALATGDTALIAWDGTDWSVLA